jgi:hypothetical protein
MLRYLGVIGIRTQNSRTKVGKLDLAVLMRMYVSTLRRDLILLASRCQVRKDLKMGRHWNDIKPIDREGMMEAGRLLESYCALVFSRRAWIVETLTVCLLFFQALPWITTRRCASTNLTETMTLSC